MSYGFEFTNTSGRVVISETQRRLVFARVVSGIIPGTVNSFQGVMDTFLWNVSTGSTNASNPPVVFYVPWGDAHNPGSGSFAGSYSPTRIFYQGGAWRVSLVYGSNSQWAGDETAIPYKLYVFEDGPPTQGGGWGAELFSSGSRLIFSTEGKPLVISQLATFNRGPDTFHPWTPQTNLIWWEYGSDSVPLSSSLQNKQIAINMPSYVMGSIGGDSDEFGVNYYTGVGYARRGGNSLSLSVGFSGGYYAGGGSGTPGAMVPPLWSTASVGIIETSLYD